METRGFANNQMYTMREKFQLPLTEIGEVTAETQVWQNQHFSFRHFIYSGLMVQNYES